VADGGGLENRYGVCASSWVRIPRPPQTLCAQQHSDSAGAPRNLTRNRDLAWIPPSDEHDSRGGGLLVQLSCLQPCGELALRLQA
jgi:hypothetical protein